MPNSRMSKRVIYGMMGKLKMMGGAIKRRYDAAYERGNQSPSHQKIKKMMDDFGYNP